MTTRLEPAFHLFMKNHCNLPLYRVKNPNASRSMARFKAIGIKWIKVGLDELNELTLMIGFECVVGLVRLKLLQHRRDRPTRTHKG